MAQNISLPPWGLVILAWIAGMLTALCLAELWRRPAAGFYQIFWSLLVLVPFVGPVLFLGRSVVSKGTRVEGLAAIPEFPANFTRMAQEALKLAREEANRFNHHFVGTEHLLLGVIKLGRGVAVNVLQKMGLQPEKIRTEIENLVGTGPEEKKMSPIPYTPRTKRVLSLAVNEAKTLDHTYVGTEHILLGLLREGDGVAARVLQNLGVNIERTRQEVLKELDPNSAAGES